MNRIRPLMDRMQMLIPSMPWQQPVQQEGTGPRVVLLHGLWRGHHSMEPLARKLREHGFSTLNIPYPSIRLPIEEIAQRIHQMLVERSDGRPFHLVTHSLGGIIARQMIANGQCQIQRLVMLAPPSNGSEIVDHLQSCPLLSWFLGPAGRQLATSGIPSQLPPLPTHVEAAAIMGSHVSIKCFDRILSAPHDGIVSASKGHLPELRAFAVVDADHTFISIHPEAIRLCREFLSDGSWSP